MAPVYTTAPDPGYANRGQFTTPNSPIAAQRADIAAMDVPTLYFAQNGSAAGGAWNRTPGSSGYGTNQAVSSTGAGNSLVVLNNITTDPNDQSGKPVVFDTEMNWVAIGFIANRGAGLENVTQSELQYLFTTGRTSTGENLNVATRDVGSGTRNGAMNSIGVDPSWGVGDNIGSVEASSSLDPLGPNHKVTNMSSSSRMEARVQNNRLAVGYTGLSGSSAGVADQRAGVYELLNVMMDQMGGTEYVRPSIEAIIDNADINTAYLIGGSHTWATIGDPKATVVERDGRVLLAGNANTGTSNEMTGDRQATALYILNILKSIADFTGDPGVAEQYNMPGELLANEYFLHSGMAARQNLLNPTQWVANANVNEALRQHMLANNTFGAGGGPAAYGSVNAAGKVPTRSTSVGTYSDGTNGSYYIDANGNHVVGGTNLAARNELAGDFNNDGSRNVMDVEKMMQALANPRAFEAGINHGGNPGHQAGDYAIVEVIGDFDADGNFDQHDIRYFADGLAVNPASGHVDRKVGFTLVDNETGGNFFGTTLATGKTYAAGDTRGDIAGNAVAKGAAPAGWNGIVDAADIDYVYANFGDWANINDAVLMDLSADMTGDLAVNQDDVDELVYDILGTTFGDGNLDGKVDLVDLFSTQNNFGKVEGWSGGNFYNSSTVDLTSLFAVQNSFGFDAGYPSYVVHSTPEPTTMAMLGVIAAGLMARRRRVG